ncbi:MAG: hypothetical protein ABFR95_04545 [Actinomycetota bacterium]
MKRIVPILVAIAVAALAAAKMRDGTPLPDPPEGTWELADDGTS